MPIVVGTDEAGYGPNLGPLVITATTWEVPDGITPETMWQPLEPALTDSPSRNDKRLHVSDSKKVYSAGKSIGSLERGILAFLTHLKQPHATCVELGTTVSGSAFTKDYHKACGKKLEDLKLPLSANADAISSSAALLSATMSEQNFRLLSIKSCVMFPPEFNQQVEQTNSKGKVLSSATLQLVKASVDEAEVQSENGPVTGWVVCDKHGGRNRYDDVISEAFDDQFVFRIEEGGPRSVYRVGELEFCFRTKAEAILPVALASMVSKYVREVVMTQFNRFWQQHVPDLKPTKGYPVDAARFWTDIEPTVKKLKIAKSDVWRCR
ncbi:MAG: hypothetical protein WAO83_24660 [Fuerstiella sp.]